MNKCSKIHLSIFTVLATGVTVFSSGVIAHDDNDPGAPVCLEANYMMADAMNAPFAGPVTGPGRVIEMNIITGERGITVNNPFSADNAGTPVCENGGVTCAGPWKPTGVLSGGMNGHAFLTSAAQHAITEFHRDGTAVRTAPTLQPPSTKISCNLTPTCSWPLRPAPLCLAPFSQQLCKAVPGTFKQAPPPVRKFWSGRTARRVGK